MLGAKFSFSIYLGPAASGFGASHFPFTSGADTTLPASKKDRQTLIFFFRDMEVFKNLFHLKDIIQGIV
jgi:hypothetical protein